jgi:hypothetical protein
MQLVNDCRPAKQASFDHKQKGFVLMLLACVKRIDDRLGRQTNETNN